MAVEFYKEFGELGYLANYSEHGFYKDGVYYKTVEHFYQASKFDNRQIINKIILAKTPKEASNIGRDRKNKRIDNFKDIKLDKMYEGIYLKFSQNKSIRSKLIETRNEEIREMSVKESYWGVGPSLDGKNHVGKILMKVRDKVKEDLLSSILEKCKNNKVYIIGHRKPDFDSVLSSYLLSKVLRSMGLDVVYSVRDDDFVDKELINDYLKSNYLVVNDYNDKKFLLVDHNNLDGIDSSSVVGCIDHHRISGEVEELIEMEYASTGLLIYDLFKDRYEFSDDDKKIIALSVLSDTEFLTSSRFSSEDEKLFTKLNVTLDVEYYKQKYFKVNDFSLDVKKNLFKDYKVYNYNKFEIKRSLIKSYSRDKNEYYDKYSGQMTKFDINLLIWCDYERLITYVCFNGKSLVYPSFTTSTYLILDYLKKNGYLKK